MKVRRLVSILIALSFSIAVSAQAPPVKPKTPPQKPATRQKAPPKARKAPAEPAPAPAPPPPTDVQLRTRYIHGAQVSENRTYIRGARQRFEFPGLTMITQCDLNRSLWINDAAREYMEVSAVQRSAAASIPAELAPQAGSAEEAAAAGSETKSGKAKGGVITERVTVTDTGERKQMFGAEARRIIILMTREPDENACETNMTSVKTDAWYTDLPEGAACPTVSAPTPLPPPADTCTDRVVRENTGQAKVGFALSTKTTTTVVDAKATDRDREAAVTTMAMEVTDLKITSLDASLFDVPAGYTRIEDYKTFLFSLGAGGNLSDALFGSVAAGTSSVAPKQPGIVRVGIVTPKNSSGREVPAERLAGSLLAGFTHAPFESLPLSGSTTADLQRDAVDKACDYLLYTDITEIKTSKPGRVGGFLKKMAKEGPPPSEIHEVRIEYKLYAVGDPGKARITSSVKASSGGGFGLRSALRVAAFAGQMYLTMGMGSGLMGMLGVDSPFGGLMGGFGDGLPGQRTNPGMSAAFSILSAAGNMAAGDGQPSGAEDQTGKVTLTVEEGLSKASRQAAAQLKKAQATAK